MGAYLENVGLNMNTQQRNIMDGMTVEELARLLVDLQYNRTSHVTTNHARVAGITPLDVSLHIFHRLV